jgi:hypothetical protein
VCGTIDDPHILDRRRLTIVPSEDAANVHPYHVAAELGATRGRAVVDRCAAHAEALAKEGLESLCAALSPQRPVVCGILTSRVSAPPPFETVLRSHTAIHAAEGLLFREALARAAVACGLDVRPFAEGDILADAAKRWRSRPDVVERRLAELRKRVGPPWTRDEKLATLAALLALGDGRAPASRATAPVLAASR